MYIHYEKRMYSCTYLSGYGMCTTMYASHIKQIHGTMQVITRVTQYGYMLRVVLAVYDTC